MRRIVELGFRGSNDLLKITCFGCGEKGHYKDKCPKAGNQQNDGARGRAYVVVENPQQNPNVVTGERPEKDLCSLACIKADEKKLDDIRVVRDFPEGQNKLTKRTVTLSPGIDDFLTNYKSKANEDSMPLSRKKDSKPRRVRAMSITIHSGLKTKILEAQSEASKDLKAPTEWLRGLERHFEQRDNGEIYFFDRIWIPSVGGVRKLIMDEAHTSRYSVHPGADKMYYDLRDLYWWPATTQHQLRVAPFEALYGRKCRSPVIWTEVGESQLIGPEIVQETTEKIFQIKERLKTARSRQKSYADKRRKPLEFEVGDRVLLKVSPWKGVVRFGKKGKLAPRYVGPFEIIERVGPVAYRLKLPQELSCVHNTFHVSNLKKCLAEPDVQVPLDEIEIDENLRFVEEPIEIVERDVKKLKRRRIPLVKVRWNSRQGAEYTWEREDQFRKRYPNLFSETVPPSDPTVNLWTHNLVIRHRVKDLQLGIESYQKQLNLTKPGWDATGYEYKHDYTIIKSPHAVVFPVSNNERKIMRFYEIYKFSDGKLTNILEALHYRVKEYKVNRFNPGMNTRFWTDKDVARSKEFIHAIEQRLKTRRIFQNLECFVGCRVRDIDYRLLQRTK
ncbi:putative reverse transcriptase domain-containing protein [Tanacetum coccineum]